MGLLDRGMAALRDRLEAAGGGAVAYTRGAETFAVVAVASAGRSLAEAVGRDLQPIRTEAGERDYLISSAAMAAIGFGEPQRADRIAEVIDGVTCTFEVAPRDTEPAWRWSDESRLVYRLHCRQVS